MKFEFKNIPFASIIYSNKKQKKKVNQREILGCEINDFSMEKYTNLILSRASNCVKVDLNSDFLKCSTLLNCQFAPEGKSANGHQNQKDPIHRPKAVTIMKILSLPFQIYLEPSVESSKPAKVSSDLWRDKLVNPRVAMHGVWQC